jgi:hypothetical protein
VEIATDSERSESIQGRGRLFLTLHPRRCVNRILCCVNVALWRMSNGRDVPFNPRSPFLEMGMGHSLGGDRRADPGLRQPTSEI